MSGHALLQYYSPLSTLLVGLGVSLGLLGIGLPVADRLKPPGPFRLPLEFIIGLLVVSAATQVLGFIGAVNRSTMWLLTIALVLGAVVAGRRAFLNRGRLLAVTQLSRMQRLLALVLAVIVVIHVAIAVAPSTRHDETAYHILVPARLWSEGGFVFHRLPFEATVFPQFTFQISQTVFHFLGWPDAAAIVSLAAALLIAWFGFSFVRWQTGDIGLGLIVALALLGSGFSAVFMTTVGPHAFQFLATTIAVVAALNGDWILRECGKRAYALLVAVPAAAMIGSKLTMVPLAALVIVAALYWLARSGSRPRDLAGHVLTMGLVVLLAIAPMTIWTWLSSGSPGGITTLTRFADPRIYDGETIEAYRASLAMFVETSSFKPIYEASYWNPLVIAATLLYPLLETSLPRRVIAATFLAVQVALILFVLPTEIRHIGGLQYAFLIMAVAPGIDWIRRLALNRRLPDVSKDRLPAMTGAAALVLLLPWLALLLWFSVAFLPVSLGLQSPQAFVARYSPLSTGFAQLDKALPADAVLYVGKPRVGDASTLSWLSRPPMWYAPRASTYHRAELPPTSKPFLLLLRQPGETTVVRDEQVWLPTGTKLGSVVLHDPAACLYPQRVPNGGCVVADLMVFSLVSDQAK